MRMFQKQRIDVKSAYNIVRVFKPAHLNLLSMLSNSEFEEYIISIVPHCRTIKVNKKPFVRIEIERIGSFHSFHIITVFLANESRSFTKIINMTKHFQVFHIFVLPA